jgi:hypothetical protein
LARPRRRSTAHADRKRGGGPHWSPGDHVHLAIDFKGVGYAWELTGVLGKPPDVRFSWLSWLTWSSRYSTTTRTTHTPASASASAKYGIDGE